MALPWLGRDAAAQQATASALTVPLTGMADLGGAFSGSFTIRDFRVQDDQLVATGTATGVLSDASGMTRTLVLPLALPVDTDASSARRDTDIGLAGTSCSMVPIDLGAASVSVRGTTIAFSPASLDVAAPGDATTPVAPPATGFQTGSVPSFERPVGGARPGTITTGPSMQVTQQPDVASVLCAASQAADSADRARLVQALNQVVAAFR
ncbi:MAG: hypothetical protein AB7L71_00555 [Vicinamibacterales bacterium]